MEDSERGLPPEDRDNSRLFSEASWTPRQPLLLTRSTAFPKEANGRSLQEHLE